MRRLLIVVLVLLAAGCTDAEEQTPAVRETNIGVSETTLETTYEFEEYPGSTWHGREDEAIRSTEVIAAATDPDHCGWDVAVLLNMGSPLGEKTKSADKTRQYLRDPEGVLEPEWMVGDYEAEVELPKGAEYTGYRTDFMELWFDPDDDARGLPGVLRPR